MSNRYKGGVLSATPPTTSSSAAPGIWTLEQQMQATAGTGWPFGGPFTYIEDVFSTWLYTGTNATQTITNGIDLSTKGGLVWIKSRTSVDPGTVFDTARGATNYLFTPTTAAQATLANTLTAFNSNGFSLGTDNNIGTVNTSTTNYVSWTFREQAKFFDVVTYTGNGSAPRNISHNLGSVPGCIMIKRTDTTSTWTVYHAGIGNTKALFLNADSAADTNSAYWNNTTPTSTVFTLGGTFSDINASGGTYVAYLFAHDAGGFGLTGSDNVITCGSFTTNGSGIIPTVNLGYEPQWILAKPSSGTGNWFIMDNMRSWYNQQADQGNALFPNTSGAEAVGYNAMIPTATGFTGPNVNFGAGVTYIYIAIRRGPMKVPTLGTSVYNGIIRTGTQADATVTGVGFPVDLTFTSLRGATHNPVLSDRLRGAKTTLSSRGDYADTSEPTALTSFASMDGVSFGPNNTDFFNGFNSVIGGSYINWFFRRAPGFFDEVCYTGTGSATAFNHNLGVVPELIICKKRSATGDWYVYSSFTGNASALILQLADQSFATTSAWNSTTPTSTTFTLGANTQINGSGATNVAYLFATCPGVSKVGSYTGTAALLTVNCGFTTGARFVLIKRTDSTGDWYMYDSARGITSGNDPYLFANSTAAEVAGTNYVDTDTTGFKVTAAAPAGLNANGGTYIFLAIA